MGTHPDYRRRGLAREPTVRSPSSLEPGARQADAGDSGHTPLLLSPVRLRDVRVHRQGRRIYAQDVPGKKPSSLDGSEGSSHFYRLRPAAASDARFSSDLNRWGRGRYPLTSAGDEGLWRYEVAGRNSECDESLGVWIVEDAAGKSAGYGCRLRDFRGGTMQVEPTNSRMASPG